MVPNHAGAGDGWKEGVGKSNLLKKEDLNIGTEKRKKKKEKSTSLWVGSSIQGS